MTTYNIVKKYDQHVSKSCTEEKGLTFDAAKDLIILNAERWKRNGGLIVSQSDTVLVVSEPDDSETITWSLEEIEEWS